MLIFFIRQKKIITKNLVMENYVRSRSFEGTFQHPWRTLKKCVQDMRFDALMARITALRPFGM
jgi:hypothetical protein